MRVAVFFAPTGALFALLAPTGAFFVTRGLAADILLRALVVAEKNSQLNCTSELDKFLATKSAFNKIYMWL